MRSLLYALVLALTGCGARAFACDGDADCRDGGELGRCEDNGACSFPDPACPSGRRYGEHVGDGLANTCVPEDPIAGTDTSSAASTDVASSTVATSSTATTLSDSSDGWSSTDDGTATTDATLPTTDATTESTETTTADPAGDPYGPCVDEPCAEGSECAPFGALPLTCAPPCDVASDCPLPTGIDTVPTCLDDGGDGWCAIPCSNDSDCPMGMECTGWESQVHGDLCTWF
jgi:hypothetical protein